MKWLVILLIIIGCGDYDAAIPVEMLDKSRAGCQKNGGLQSINAKNIYRAYRSEYKIILYATCTNLAVFTFIKDGNE